MSNPLKGEAAIELADGRKLTLAYDFDGLIALEEASGMKMTAIYKEFERLTKAKEEPSMRLARAVFYGGLQQHHPEITLKEVGDIILTDMDALTKAFSAFEGSHGPSEGGSAGDATMDPQKALNGTGPLSSEAGVGPGSRRKHSGGKQSGATLRQ